LCATFLTRRSLKNKVALLTMRIVMVDFSHQVVYNLDINK